MSSLGLAYRNADRPDLAQPLLENTLRSMQSSFPPDHHPTLITMDHLGLVYLSLGQPQKALSLHERALDAKRKTLGNDHLSTVESMCHLAFAFWATGQLDRSIPLFEEALRHRETLQGPAHPESVRTRANLAVNYRDAGRTADALPLLETAFSQIQNRPQLRWIAQELIKLYRTLNLTEKAASLVPTVLAEARQQLPPDSINLASTLGYLGTVLGEAGSWAESAALLRESLDIRERLQPSDWLTFDTRSRLGSVLTHQSKFQEAEPLVLSGYEGLLAQIDSIPPADRQRVLVAAERIVELYDAWNRPSQAASYRLRLGLSPLPATLFAEPEGDPPPLK